MSRRSILLDPAAEPLPRRTPRPVPIPTRPPGPVYLTLSGFLRLYGITGAPRHLSRQDRARLMSAHGRRLTELSQRRGWPVRKIFDPRRGTANTYALAVLQEYFHAGVPS